MAVQLHGHLAVILASGMFMADPELLPKAERSLVLHLLDQVPPLADAVIIAKRLNALLRRKTPEGLSAIMDAAARTPLKEFTASLRRDIGRHPSDARPAMDHKSRRGTGEPLKSLKRTMFGRAGFQLLRARVLHAA